MPPAAVGRRISTSSRFERNNRHHFLPAENADSSGRVQQKNEAPLQSRRVAPRMGYEDSDASTTTHDESSNGTILGPSPTHARPLVKT